MVRTFFAIGAARIAVGRAIGRSLTARSAAYACSIGSTWVTSSSPSSAWTRETRAVRPSLDPDHALADLQRGLEVGARAGDDPPPAEGVEDRPVEVPADDPAHGARKRGQQVGERGPVVLGQADLVEGAVAGAQRRVVHGDDRRRRAARPRARRPRARSRRSSPSSPVSRPARRRVAGDQAQLADVGRVLERPAGDPAGPVDGRSTRAARRGRRGFRPARTTGIGSGASSSRTRSYSRAPGSVTRSPLTRTASGGVQRRATALDRGRQRSRRAAVAAPDADVGIAELREDGQIFFTWS